MTTMVMISVGPSARGVGEVGREPTYWRVSARLSELVVSEWDSGWKFSATTALGMTLTMSGSSDARRTVFSLHVCDTHMTWSTSLRVNLSSLLVSILAASAKPNNE
jgi:hypothetical protein